MNAVALLTLTLFLVAPGLGAVLAAFSPGRPSVTLAAGLVVPLGFAVDGVLAFALAAGRVLRPWTLLPLIAAATVALWWVALRRGSPTDRLAALRTGVREERWTVLAGAAVIVAIAAVRLAYPSVLNLTNSSTWRYWADGREIAVAGRFPARVLQYGALFRPTTNKAFLNAFNAGASFVTGRQPLPAVGALTWIGAVGLALSLWALAHELGIRGLAVLLPVLLVVDRVAFDRELTADLLTYKAETFGRLAAFAGVALAARALRRRRAWPDAVLTGALLAATAATHLVPLIIAGLLVAGVIVGAAAGERSIRGRIVPALALLGTTLVGGLVLLFVPSGTIGISGPNAARSAYDRFAPGFDPTRYINAGVLPGHLRVVKGTWALSVGRVVRGYATTSLHLERGSILARHAGAVGAALLVAGLVFAVAVALWFPRPLRAAAAAAWALMAGIVAATWVASHLATFYIQAYFGIRRLFDYNSIAIILGSLVMVEAGLLLLVRRRSARAASAVAVALVVVVSAAVVPSGRKPANAGGRTPDVVASLDWMRANLPCDAVVLANVHTEGAFEALTGRPALLEGLTPYLRPDIMVPALRLLLGARAFFHDPLHHVAYLRSHGVTDVVILKAGGLGYAEPIGHADASALRSAPFLRLVHSGPGADVFHVTGRPAVRMPAAPGYGCPRDPLET